MLSNNFQKLVQKVLYIETFQKNRDKAITGTQENNYEIQFQDQSQEVAEKHEQGISFATSMLTSSPQTQNLIKTILPYFRKQLCLKGYIKICRRSKMKNVFQ